jgi:transmembrane sensor
VAVKADGNAEQQLTDGQRVDYWPGGISPMVAVNPQQAFGWRDGRLAFRQAPLSQALAVVQRYYPGRILLLDRDLGERRVNGDFSSADPQAILAAFQSVLGFTLQRLPGGMVVIL